ncbi:MAG: dihydrodipicolinate synthase family protein [Gammaproteobacteria bacterium]|nr:dihydrodipicolinate synthase family protein [Gammaproteobacteria bacterium]MDH4254054.1 dihydrodipicolinate synthase family protein [Gammaproteobacteria bacterium]MDH5309529.1 dihydrodipicolinate synthase family protein [Gammaproteobacteria bacterium]
MSKTFHGCYTVAVTPFTDDGSDICLDSLKAFLDWQIACEVPGVILLGTTGEFLTISEDERYRLVEAAVSHVNGRMDVLVGSMNAYTPKAVQFSREAEKLGADGLMVIPPYYYTPTDDEIFEYYKAVSEAVSIPIMLYNNPFTSNIDMSADLVARLTRAFDNVRYIKEASMDVGRVFEIVRKTDGVMNVFAGERPVECFLLGAVGYVNPYGNYIPYATTRMWDFLDGGDIETALHIQEKAHEINEVIAEGHPRYGHQCYSKALAAAAGYPMGDVRRPLTRFDQLGPEGIERREKILAMMQRLDEFMNGLKVPSNRTA